MRMTAAVMYEQGLPAPYAESKPFWIEDVEVEAPGEGEVLVEVRAEGWRHRRPARSLVIRLPSAVVAERRAA